MNRIPNNWRMAAARGQAGQIWAHAATETVLLASVLPALLLWLSPGRTLSYVIPALVLIPLACGLRGGFVLGSLSAMLVTAVMVGTNYLRPLLLADYSGAQVVCLFLVGAAAGNVSDYWNTELRRMTHLCNHCKLRMNSLKVAHQILQASHAQLEHRIAGNQQSLRTLMQRLAMHGSDLQAGVDNPMDDMGQPILDVMVEAASVYVAAVHEISDLGVPHPEALARQGNPGKLSAFHPLLREALRTGTVAFVLPDTAGPGNELASPALVAVVPLVDAADHIHAVVAIEDMRFPCMRPETFVLIGLLGRHIGNLLTRRARSAGENASPYCFSQCLQEQLACSIRYGAPAMLLALRAASPSRSAALVRHCGMEGRDLDQNWIMTNHARLPVIIKLLPMTDEAGAKAYLERMTQLQSPGEHDRNDFIVQAWPVHQAVSTSRMLSELRDAFGLAASEPRPIPVSAIAAGAGS